VCDTTGWRKAFQEYGILNFKVYTALGNIFVSGMHFGA
jgi:hypothetical protein